MRQAAAAAGLHLLGVVGAQDRPRRAERAAGALPIAGVLYRDLFALTYDGEPGPPTLDRATVQTHHQALDRAMGRGNVVPFPAGVVFRDRRSVRRFLTDQYAPLDEALSLVSQRWAFRVHARGHDERQVQDAEVAEIYNQLRRLARAAAPLVPSAGLPAGAAYLVERAASDRFLERVHRLEHEHPGVALDVTGPWPPYDFVRILPTELPDAPGLDPA